jgi:hypothetical protein
MLPPMDNLVTLSLVATGTGLLRSVIKVAREPILLGFVTLMLILLGILSLTLSGLVLQGWWQAAFLELGVGLLVVSIVEVAVLGFLHAVTDGDTLRKILDKTTIIESELIKHSILPASAVTGKTTPSAPGSSPGPT